MQSVVHFRIKQLLFLHKREGLATQLLLALGGTVELDLLKLPSADGLRFSAPMASGSGATLSEESQEQLRALGYLD